MEGNTPIIESLRTYLIASPLLADLKKRLGIDYLGEGEGSYTIDSVPGDPVIRRYADGGSLRQFLFIFASKEFYGADPLQNIESIGFYEDLERWFREQTKEKSLPALSGRRSAQSLETMTSGYIFDTQDDRARYQIQARLVYYED